MRDSFNDYVTKVKGGDVGALPAVAALIVLVIVFTILTGSKFTNAFNFSNLILQGSAIATFGMGLVFALLIGEIDLSAGYTGGVCAGVLGILMTNHNWPWVPALVVCILTGTVIGLLDRSARVEAGCAVVRGHPGLLPGAPGRPAACRPVPAAPSPTATRRSWRS